jgi:hypothetical protein
MTTAVARERVQTARMSRRALNLAERLEHGAHDLLRFASRLSDAEWKVAIPHDGRSVGVVVHHVASVYPVEIKLARLLAEGQAVEGVTVDDIHAMNAEHARTWASVTREAALELLQRNSEAAAEAIRALSDEELDEAAPASLYSNAPVTCQFMLEDHAVRHSYHHLAKIRKALGR